MPIGTPSSLYNSQAKAVATALNSSIFPAFHAPVARSIGCSAENTLVTWNSRMTGCFSLPALTASAMRAKSAATSHLPAIHCMFDWPEAIQTSPTRTFLRTTFLPSLAVMIISTGSAFALSGASLTSHLPFLPASALTFCPANSTVIFVLGLLQPQTGKSISRCRTALSAKGAPSSISGAGLAAGLSSAANAAMGESSRAAMIVQNAGIAMTLLFMVVLSYSTLPA